MRFILRSALLASSALSLTLLVGCEDASKTTPPPAPTPTTSPAPADPSTKPAMEGPAAKPAMEGTAPAVEKPKEDMPK